MKAVIEVGTNIGQDTPSLLRKYDDSMIISFEPIPDLYELNKNKITHERVEFVNAAIGLNSGSAKFNITSTAGKFKHRGSSSLYSFADDLQQKWPREDFNMVETIDVQVYSMEDVIENYRIDHIPYMHCDAQGGDLDVLKSYGKYINILDGGVIEVSDKISLYKGNVNGAEEARQWLEAHGFHVYKTAHNDPLKAELNMWFERV